MFVLYVCFFRGHEWFRSIFPNLDRPGRETPRAAAPPSAPRSPALQGPPAQHRGPRMRMPLPPRPLWDMGGIGTGGENWTSIHRIEICEPSMEGVESPV